MGKGMGEGWCLGRPGLGRTTGGLGFRDREAFPSPWNTLPHLRSTLSSKAPFAQVAIYVSVSPKPGEAQVASGPQSPYRTGKVLGRGAVGLAGPPQRGRGWGAARLLVKLQPPGPQFIHS